MFVPGHAFPLASQPSIQAKPCMTKPVLPPTSPPSPVLVTPPAPVSLPSPAYNHARETISTPVDNATLLGSPDIHTFASTTDLPAYISTPTYTWTYFPSTESINDMSIFLISASKLGKRITTSDGYALPLSIRHGLPYLAMRKYTTVKFDTLPHVIMTSDKHWDPSVLDTTISAKDEQFLQKYPPQPQQLPYADYDEYGNPRCLEGLDIYGQRLIHARK
eukprot:jgi/Psemu1/59899/gm1.59899_g